MEILSLTNRDAYVKAEKQVVVADDYFMDTVQPSLL